MFGEVGDGEDKEDDEDDDCDNDAGNGAAGEVVVDVVDGCHSGVGVLPKVGWRGRWSAGL